MTNPTRRYPWPVADTPRPTLLLFLLLALAALLPSLAGAQQVLTEAEQTVTVVRGNSALLQVPAELERVSIADPAVAEAVVLSPREVLINGVTLGTTSLLLWREDDRARLYRVEVVADLAALERQLQSLYPAEPIEVTTVDGETVVVSGLVSNAAVVRGVEQLAAGTGATVVNRLQVPEAAQILLHVRFAEVSRNWFRELGSNLSVLNPQNTGPIEDGDIEGRTLSEGIVNLILGGEDYRLEALIEALKGNGEFRSLAEPNLIAADGQEATFLAGGEFPFPVVQGGNQAGAVTIEWREFGVRLNFTPTVTDNGNVRLRVAPEVSSLDFTQGLTLQGFQIPALLARRVETEVELRPGQHLALAGLIDNSLLENVDKIPFLGDIPLLGLLFQSQDMRHQRTELLVIVTPHLISPTDEAPAVPTGEPDTWDWKGGLDRDTTTTPARSGS